MGLLLGDPGPCPICGAPHTTCTGAEYVPVVLVQLPARDAAIATTGNDLAKPSPPAASAPPAVGETFTTGPGETFTTGTYRRKRGG